MKYFSTCIITTNDRLKGTLYIDKDLYIDFNNHNIVCNSNSSPYNLSDTAFECLEKTIVNSCKDAKGRTTTIKVDGKAEEIYINRVTNKEYLRLSRKTRENVITNLNKIDKRITKYLMKSIRSEEGYCSRFNSDVAIYKMQNEDINDNSFPDERIIRKFLAFQADATSFVKYVSSQDELILKNELWQEKTPREQKISFPKESEGLLIKMYNIARFARCNEAEINYKETFKDFLVLLLYQKKYENIITEQALNAYKFKDDFEENLLSNGPFDEFSDTSNELIEFYRKDLYNFYELSNPICSNTLLQQFYEAFKQTYCLEDSLAVLHKYGKNCDRFAAEKICEYLKNKIDQYTNTGISREDFAIMMYSILFYISHGFICEKFHEVINGIDSDREEFNREVLAKYGCSGNPGIYAIYRMTNRPTPNAIAVFEAGELEYYGRGSSKQPNFEKAFYLYKKGCYSLSNFNPLSAWSYSYMLYKYKEKELTNAYIEELECDIEQLGEHEAKKKRKIAAIEPALKAFNCGCYAAANILGQMLDDAEIPQEYKINFTRTTSQEYFEEASKGGYVFAKNQLYSIWTTRAESETNQEKKRGYFEKAFSYLKESADLCEPWACNKYADSYLIKIHKNYDDAFKYFIDAYNLGVDNTKEWAAANIIKYYMSGSNQTDDKIACLLSANSPSIDNFNSFYSELLEICRCSKNKDIKDIFDNCISKGVNIND